MFIWLKKDLGSIQDVIYSSTNSSNLPYLGLKCSGPMSVQFVVKLTVELNFLSTKSNNFHTFLSPTSGECVVKSVCACVCPQTAVTLPTWVPVWPLSMSVPAVWSAWATLRERAVSALSGRKCNFPTLDGSLALLSVTNCLLTVAQWQRRGLINYNFLSVCRLPVVTSQILWLLPPWVLCRYIITPIDYQRITTV